VQSFLGLEVGWGGGEIERGAEGRGEGEI